MKIYCANLKNKNSLSHPLQVLCCKTPVMEWLERYSGLYSRTAKGSNPPHHSIQLRYLDSPLLIDDLSQDRGEAAPLFDLAVRRLCRGLSFEAYFDWRNRRSG